MAKRSNVKKYSTAAETTTHADVQKLMMANKRLLGSLPALLASMVFSTQIMMATIKLPTMYKFSAVAWGGSRSNKLMMIDNTHTIKNGILPNYQQKGNLLMVSCGLMLVLVHE